MKDQAVVADNKPKKVELNKGEEYYFCACGKSANQPYCDGSHKGTSFTPKKFTAEESGEAYLCMCKQKRREMKKNYQSNEFIGNPFRVCTGPH